MTIEMGSFHIEQKIQLAASPEQVFGALTKDIDKWWKHRMNGGAVSLEARVGGQFIERWGDGEGAIWGTVQRINRPDLLRLAGPLGMDRPVSAVYEYRLAEEDGGTCLSLSHRVVGDLNPEWEAMYNEGWRILLDHLHDWVVDGKSL